MTRFRKKLVTLQSPSRKARPNSLAPGRKASASAGREAAKPDNGGLLLGYARVSKGDEQTNILQARALQAAGCWRIFEEAASGGRWDRPKLHRMLDHLREARNGALALRA